MRNRQTPRPSRPTPERGPMGDTPPSPEVPPVRRFTTDYDIGEDRIRLTLERPDDSVVRIWLTRRLAARAVPELAGILDRKIVKHGEPVRGEGAQRRDQMEALGRLEPQEPVRPSEDEGFEDYLVTGIGLRLTPRAILVDFKVRDEVVQTVPFAIPHMRQWLAVLHLAFRKGSWDDDIWPDWLKPAEPGTSPPGIRLN